MGERSQGVVSCGCRGLPTNELCSSCVVRDSSTSSYPARACGVQSMLGVIAERFLSKSVPIGREQRREVLVASAVIATTAGLPVAVADVPRQESIPFS